MSRHVRGLLWAQECPRGPFGPQKRKKGAKARGLAFEKEVGRALPSPSHWAYNPWFQFADGSGMGYAQPDYVLRTKSEVLVLECKLTDTLEAYDQLGKLYLPILEHVYGLPVYGIVVAKALRPGSPVPCSSLREAFACARSGVRFPLLHWLGHSSLR